jgi:hypothetical protein
MYLSTEYVDFTALDLSYLEAARWDHEYLSAVLSAPLVTPRSFTGQLTQARVEYDSLTDGADSFVQLAHWYDTCICACMYVCVCMYLTMFKSLLRCYCHCIFVILVTLTHTTHMLVHRAGAMDNIKAGVPRTAYRGVVSLWHEGVKLHIAPRTLRLGS